MIAVELSEIALFWVSGAGAGLLAGLVSMRAPLAAARREARTDKLTQVANRAGFEADVARRAAAGEAYGLVLVDLDFFKQINDTHGHAVGDEVLVEVASRLTALAVGADLVARLGGDEFVMVVAGKRATIVANCLHWVMWSPVLLTSGERIPVTASIGVVVQAGPGVDSADVLRSADVALYRAKGTRDAVVEFEPAGRLATAPTARPPVKLREYASAGLHFPGVPDGWR